MRAVVVAVGDFPQMNARFDDDNGVVKRHRARAPRRRRADAEGPDGPGRQARRGARPVGSRRRKSPGSPTAARTNTITLEELSGSTITITSLGALGGIVSTPIINYPEVAIIGVNKIVDPPGVRRRPSCCRGRS